LKRLEDLSQKPRSSPVRPLTEAILDAALAHLRELSQIVAERGFVTGEQRERLQELLGSSPWQSECLSLRQALERFDYPASAEILDRLLAKLPPRAAELGHGGADLIGEPQTQLALPCNQPATSSR